MLFYTVTEDWSVTSDEGASWIDAEIEDGERQGSE